MNIDDVFEAQKNIITQATGFEPKFRYVESLRASFQISMLMVGFSVFMAARTVKIYCCKTSR